MERNKQYFLDFLAGHASYPVLFEPFLSHTHAETLIWRRGAHLWSTPDALLDTLVLLTERTQADVVFVDLRDRTDAYKEALLDAVDRFAAASPLGFGVICTGDDIARAEAHEGVCCLCVYGHGQAMSLPVIRMDGSIEDAIEAGDSGWFCMTDAEMYLASHGSDIRILGGYGMEHLLDGAAVAIYDRVEALDRAYPGQWACGSGGVIPDANYLDLISLLGAFARIRPIPVPKF